MEIPDRDSLSDEGLFTESNSGTHGSEGESSSVNGEESERTIAQYSEGGIEENPPTTVETENTAKDATQNENANNDDPRTASPSMTSVSSLEKSDSNNEEDSNEETGCPNGSSKVRTLVFSPIWSESLKSPKDVLKFSPSEARSCHGLGLQLAVERSVATSLFLGNVLVFFTNTGALYEQMGMNLTKMAQFIHPQQMPREISINDDFEALYEDLLSLGGGFRSLGKFYRSSIVAPLKKILSTNGSQRDATLKQYKQRKQASVEARKLALVNYSKLTNATKTAEDEIQEWYSTLQGKEIQQTGEEGEDIEGAVGVVEKDLPWEKSLKLIGKKKNEEDATIRLIRNLKLVQSCKINYNNNVEEENDCVLLSQESESLALSTTQKAEEDQINFLVKDILTQVFPHNKNGQKLPVAHTSIATSDADRPFAEGIEKKGIELLSGLNLFKQQSLSYEEGMGVMDAETLGLPESLGTQRDKIKSSFSARETRIEVTDIIIKLFEEINGATSKSSLRMLSLISNQRRKESTAGSISEFYYSSTVGSLWRQTLSVFEDEAKLISGMAFRITKLEKWLTVSKRILENDKELDDAAWKRVCDAARVEMRLESRYNQTKQNVEKIRQRASSKELSSCVSPQNSPKPQRARVDSSGGLGFSNRSLQLPGIQNTPNKFGRAFFKGGEAMKKLTENAMVQISQITLNEVDQKEAKDHLAYEEARVEKKSAIIAYKTRTKERIEKIDSEDESGWMEMKEIILKLTGSIGDLKKARCIKFQNRISQKLESSLQPLLVNMEKWSANAQEKIERSEQPSSSTSCQYALSIQPIKCDNIDALLGMTETDLTLPDLKLSIEGTNEGSKAKPVDSEKPRPLYGMDLNGDDNSDNEVAKIQNLVIVDQGNKENVSESTSDAKTALIDTGTSPVAAKEASQQLKEKEESPEVKAFIKQFWSKKPKDEKVPSILDVIQCAYRPKERVQFLITNLFGILYTTKEAIYFLASNKNFTLKWEAITKVEKEKGFMGSNNETDLVVSYRSGDAISSFLLCRVKDRDDVLAKLLRLKAESDKSQEVSDSDNGDEPQLPPVPPDTLQKTMEVVVSKKIKNIPIQSVFENIWADRTEGESFYESWLKEEECFDIGMGEWEIAETGKKFRNEWCNEEYDQQRLVTFKFNRTTHLYIGPPVAIVKQRHFIRVEDNDKCILAISAEFEGIPYADTFAVEMRWIATRIGRKDVMVKVGLFVNFKKTTMMKSQIKSGTTIETKNVHLRLFDAVKRACMSPGDDESDNDKEEEEEEETERDTAELGLLSCLGPFSDYIDLGQFSSYVGGSKIVPLVGVAALFFAGRYLTQAIFGNSGKSDIERLEITIQELRNEVHALHESIDSMSLLLKDSKRVSSGE